MAAPREDYAAKRSIRWWLGLFQASIFTVGYFISPIYIIGTVFLLFFPYPLLPVTVMILAAPLFLSTAMPPITSPWVLKQLRPMLDYFQYEEIVESSPVDVRKNIKDVEKPNYILAFQPHGVLTLCGMCSAIYQEDDIRGDITVGVASALLYTPLLKHIMGIFGLISASRSSLKNQLRKKGAQGTVALYVGGMAELFLCCNEEEMLYLKKRKGFIKLALQEGVDVVPVYLFGNTTVLSVVKNSVLAELSRTLQVSVTYFWGKWLLPIPRDEKVSQESRHSFQLVLLCVSCALFFFLLASLRKWSTARHAQD
jgi:hypothetical protein